MIADEKVITALTNMNGIISLSPGSMGPAMATEMIARGDLLRLSNEVIRPFYKQRVEHTIEIIRRYLSPERCLIHKPEGAIFLWLWFGSADHHRSAVSAPEKARRADGAGPLLLPGLEHDWPHTHQCMRMNYVPDPGKSSAAWRSRRKRSNARIRKANAN